LPSSPIPFRFPLGNANLGEQFRREVRGDRVVGPAEPFVDVSLAYSPCFPSAIQMFESVSGESRLGLITEN